MKFVQAILLFALISLMMCVNIRQEQAPVQAVETPKPEVQGEEEAAPVEQTNSEVAGEEDAAPTEGEEAATEGQESVADQEGEEEAQPVAQETAATEGQETVADQEGEEEAQPVAQETAATEGEEEVATKTEEQAVTPVAQETAATEGEEEVATKTEEQAVTPVAQEATPVQTEVQTVETKQEDGEPGSGSDDVTQAKTESKANTESKVESKTEAKLTPWAKPGVPEDHTRIKVLTRDGTTKDILVADSSKDLENSRNCQRDNLNNPVIQLCANLICDECLNSDVCGWCGESGKCMAGNPGDALCPGDCLNHWFFHDQTNCPRLINSGSFSNVAPESTKLIVPELAVPKLRVTTSEIDEAKLTVQVVTGTQQTTTSSRQVDEDGIIDEVHQAQQSPMTSDLVQKAPTEHKVTEITTDLQTGERLDVPDTEIKTHGVDQVSPAKL